jgi:hypothetical protein
MARIRSLKPNVTRDEAIEQLTGNGVAGLFRNAVFGPLRSVAEFYVPFQLFQVEIVNGGKREQRILGLDAVNGALDLFHFEQLPGSGEVIFLESRNCAQAILDQAVAQDLTIAKVRRVLFTAGFFRIRDLRISAQPVPGELYVPYWVGFRGRGMRARFAVLDAVRRRVEGAKVRRLLEQWLTTARET